MVANVARGIGDVIEPINEDAGWFDGVPIDNLKRYRNGRVRVDVTYVDGTRRRKVFAPDERVMVRTGETIDS